MSSDFCTIHGYEYMKNAYGNPIPYCAACENSDALWNGAIDAAISKTSAAIGVETLLAKHVCNELKKLKK